PIVLRGNALQDGSLARAGGRITDGEGAVERGPGRAETVRLVGAQLEQRLSGRGRPPPPGHADGPPAPAGPSSSCRPRPAPSRQAAVPTFSASSPVSWPAAGAVTTSVCAACGS